MSAPQPGSRPQRRYRWMIGGLVLVVVAGVTAFLLLHPGGGHRTMPAAQTAPKTAPPPTVTVQPLPSDASLGTGAPTEVPSTVLADAPGLPANMPPVALGSPSHYGDGVSARLVHVRAVTAQAHGPGELNGPALAVTVELTNGATVPISLDTVAVNVYGGVRGVPATPLRDGASQHLHGSLAPGRSESATYVFSVPMAQRSSVTVTVAYGAGSAGRTAVFAGVVA